MEQRIIQRLCPKTPVRRIEVNGEDVSIAAIASRIETHVVTLGNKHYPIIVIFDREGRTAECGEILDELLALLRSSKVADQKIFISIADRMTENWFLSDPSIAKRYGAEEVSFEGRNGKSQIKSLMRKNGGEAYQECIHGVRLFCEADPLAMKDRSKSFKHFFDTIIASEIDCDWLNFSLSS